MEVRSVEAILRALYEAQVRYLIVGGVAVIAHGYERLTKDFALVIGLEHANIVAGLKALQAIDYHMAVSESPEDFAKAELRERWRREKGMIVL